MRRIALAVLVSTLFATTAARANDVVAAEKTNAATDAAKDVAADPAKDDAAGVTLKLTKVPTGSPAGRTALVALQAGFAGLQAYDVYSTTKAISKGAVEVNPLMRSTVKSRMAFIGLKAAMTMMAMVAARNASVIDGQTQR